MPENRKWVNLTTAPDQLSAEMLVELLRGEGVSAMIKPSDAVSFLGVSGMSCRILVPSDELKEARAILAEREEAGGFLQP
jgi:hypothetical protein